MVLGITQETSKTSAQNNLQTPAQAFSPDGATLGDAGQSELFPVDDDDEGGGDEDDCS